MLHTLAPPCIAGATILGSLLLGGRDRRHGHEVTLMLVICLACAALGAVGELA